MGYAEMTLHLPPSDFDVELTVGITMQGTTYGITGQNGIGHRDW